MDRGKVPGRQTHLFNFVERRYAKLAGRKEILPGKKKKHDFFKPGVKLKREFRRKK
jgi:hypothetical protein